MESIRCGQFGAPMFRASLKALRGPLEIKCRRWGTINHLRAAEHPPEHPPTPENQEVPHGEDTTRRQSRTTQA